MLDKLKGTGTAIVTPFHKDGSIDFKSFEKLIEYQISSGIEYLVFLGTTGEAVVLNKDERRAIINLAGEIVARRVPVVVGIGGNNTQEITNCMRETNFERIDAVLSVSPYYNKPQQKGIFLHFKTIAAVCPVPVIIYNVPSRTGSNMTAETTLRIAREIPNVIAVKEASQNLSQCAHIIKNKPGGFLVISGNDDLALPFMALGGDGVISVVSNAFAAEFSTMIRLCLQGDFVGARHIQQRMLEITEGIYADGSPSGIKALLEMKGLCQSNVRMPLVKINKALSSQLANLLKELEQNPII